jgi:hypothetical protein
MYTISVTQSNDTTATGTQIFYQAVESLDLLKLTQLINTPPPPAPVAKKKRSDAGKPRAQKAISNDKQDAINAGKL